MPSESRRRVARDALGVGLRLPHYADARASDPPFDYYEAISENFLDANHPGRVVLAEVAARRPVVLHGVGLNLLGSDPLDERYLDAIADLADLVDADFVSDHLCWTGAQAMSHHDLLPVPFTRRIADFAVERAKYVASRIGRPFALENLTSYVAFRDSEMSEWEFYTDVIRRAGCGAMLDVNNIHVSSRNHGFNPAEYLAAVDWDSVVQVHVAGFREEGRVVVDTHDRPVSAAVMELYARAYREGGPFPTMLEWDDELPSFEALGRELARVAEARR